MREDALLRAARAGDGTAFDRLVGAHRPALTTHAYRLLGSLQDAQDTVQDALLGAWTTLGGVGPDAGVRRWLLELVTAACLVAERPPRGLPDHRLPPADPGAPLPEPGGVDAVVGPCLDAGLDLAVAPDARHDGRESVELAFVAALQDLAPAARAALLWEDVLGLRGDAATDLETARAFVAVRVGPRSQRAEQEALGEAGVRALVAGLVAAWERADADGVAALLTDDARLTMPPLPAWFEGAAAVRRFLGERLLRTPWRLTPVAANGQPALACHQRIDGVWTVGALVVLDLRDGAIARLTCFLDAAALSGLDLPAPPA